MQRYEFPCAGRLITTYLCASNFSMMKSRYRIALLMGGDSGEFDVSIASASVVKKFLDPAMFEVYPILMQKGRWVYQSDIGEEVPVDKNNFSLTIEDNVVSFDCAFIAIHGTPGEDGRLQGYLDLVGVPYTSCDLTTSAVTFNKYFCNDLALQYGMDVARTILLKKDQQWNVLELIAESGLPCFVKPNKSGSSVGVSKVYAQEELPEAIHKAFKEDDEVLVQALISGREMACGIYRSKGNLVVLPVTEIISENDFFDYEAKYSAGKAHEITPARIMVKEEEECHALTKELYERFNCKGVVRFDYFLCDGKWKFLEVNTVPGFSEGSIVPKQVQSAGINLGEFFASLILESIGE